MSIWVASGSFWRVAAPSPARDVPGACAASQIPRLACSRPSAAKSGAPLPSGPRSPRFARGSSSEEKCRGRPQKFAGGRRNRPRAWSRGGRGGGGRNGGAPCGGHRGGTGNHRGGAPGGGWTAHRRGPHLPGPRGRRLRGPEGWRGTGFHGRGLTACRRAGDGSGAWSPPVSSSTRLLVYSPSRESGAAWYFCASAGAYHPDAARCPEGRRVDLAP